MKLSNLLEAIEPICIRGREALAEDPEISSVHSRAQNVEAGGMFVAIKGYAADGHDFIEKAVQNGAAAVVVQHRLSRDQRIPVIEVADSRAALAALAATFYDHPTEKLVVIGVTGTNGKTTTSYLIESILQHAGLSVGVIGTVNYRYGGEEFDNPVTTPESLDLQRILYRMQSAGVTHVVLEVSSHALALNRVDYCRFDVAVFTNLSQDHLDYHKTMEAYWDSKKRLFTELLPAGPKQRQAVAVINRNGPQGEELYQLDLPARISVGDAPTNTVWSEIDRQNLSGVTGRIHTPRGTFAFYSPLVGLHNRENILCAAGVGEALGLAPEAIKSGIEGVEFIPGRLEPVADDRNRFIFIDYAHTPDALQNVLSSLRAVSGSRIVCVFGCGGDRDTGKRPLMGEIAASRSDLTIVTSDNPRSEKPMDIIADILPGVRPVCPRQFQPSEVSGGPPGKGFVIEPDRRAAIRLAIAAARKGEIVLIAGKGHETYQILDHRTIHFDDREEARIALRLPETGRSAAPTANPAKTSDGANPCEPLHWHVEDCLTATGGRLLREVSETAFDGICIDSRRVAPRDLFVAIKGDTHDGHRFAAEVVQKGVKGLIIAETHLQALPWQEWGGKGVACIAVEDTTRALGDLASHHRQRSRVSVAAITGSNGKTTTRQMTAAVVSRRYRTLSSRKNFNNDIGLPLTLFELCPEHQWAVVELGMNAPGEIRRLAEICRPDIGVITNIGPAHLEGVGSIEGVMQAKAELLEGIQARGTAVLNADDPHVAALARRTDRRVVLYGLDTKAEVRALDVSATARGSSFTLVLDHDTIAIDLKIPGRFMVSNALAAAAVGYVAALSPEQIKTGLEDFEPAAGRMNVVHAPNGIHIIDDTYNANPGSVQAALATMATLRGSHRSIFVSGDMKELGLQSESLHRDIGALAARMGVSRIYATGEFARALASGAAAEGLPADKILTGSKPEILSALVGSLQPGDWVLVKGSRAMAMEEIVRDLKKWSQKETS